MGKIKDKIGKIGPMMMIAMLLFSGIGFAAVLTYYGQVTSTVTVSQAVTLTGADTNGEFVSTLPDDTNLPAILSEGPHTLKNTASIPVTVKLDTTYKLDGQWTNLEGITTEYMGILELTKKNTQSDWTPTGVTEDTITIAYTLVGTTFNYDVIAGDIPSGYKLVYAMDKQDRFVAGSYATVKTLSEINSAAEGLPMAGDWNNGLGVSTANYCVGNGFDSYDHCTGAKLWIVKSDDIAETTGELSWANMANYYYETDLITYTKALSTSDIEITIPVDSEFGFVVNSIFALDMYGGEYTVTTTVAPVL